MIVPEVERSPYAGLDQMQGYYHRKNNDQHKDLAVQRDETFRWKSRTQKLREDRDAAGMNDHANRNDRKGYQELSQHKLFH